MRKVSIEELFGLMTELTHQLTGSNSRKRLNEFKSWLEEGRERGHGLFRTTSIVSIPAHNNLTLSETYFEEAGCIGKIHPTFLRLFTGLHVSQSDQTSVCVLRLEESSTHKIILKDLGERAVTTPVQFATFLFKKKRDRKSYLFYMRGKNGDILPTRAIWRDDICGWYVTRRSHSVLPAGTWVVTQELFVH